MIDDYVTVSDTFDSETLSNALKIELQTLENDIQSNSDLLKGEKEILIATIMTHSQAMDNLIVAAKSIFDLSSVTSGGRTSINWKKIGAIVGSVVVAAVAVAIVAAVVVSAGVALGAIAATAWVAAPVFVGTLSFITGGVAIGGIAGAVGAGIAATQNRCIVGLNKVLVPCD